MKHSPLTVLIATAGAETLLERTLISLSQCYLPESYLKTIVVENGQPLGAETVVQQSSPLLKAEYQYCPKGNKSAALNHALRTINENVLIFFTDDDVQLNSGILTAYEQAAWQRVRCFYGGPTYATYEKKPPGWLLKVMPASTRGWQPHNNNDYLRTPRFLGFNWAAYAGDIKALGGFNENLGPGTKPKRTGQEWNMQERMLAAGFTAVYVPEARVWHHVPRDKSSFTWFLKRRFQGGLGAGVWFVEKKGKRKFPLALIKYLFKACLLLPVHVLSLSRSRATETLGNIVAGLGRMKGYVTALLGKY